MSCCKTEYCKMTDLTRMEDICCLNKVLGDLRLSMKDENKPIVDSIDKLLGETKDTGYSGKPLGSLENLIKVLKDHKRLLKSLNNNNSESDNKKCCLSLCTCCDDDDCYTNCRPTLLDLINDFKKLNESRGLIFAFQKDITELIGNIFKYYGRKTCILPSLPDYGEMFTYIMYLIKLCFGNKCCKNQKSLACKACRPDPTIYPIVIVIFLALYFSNELQQYVQLYCCCCGKGDGACGKSNCENISVSFCKNKFSGLTSTGSQISGIIKCVEIFDLYNRLQGVADISVTCSTGHNNGDDDDIDEDDYDGYNEKNTFTGSAAGIVKNKDDYICGTVFGSVVGTYCPTDHHASGILCGLLVELRTQDPHEAPYNPYCDSQAGLLQLFSLLDKINMEKMLEIFGDNFGGYGKRLSQKPVIVPPPQKQNYKDYSKKYRKE